MRNSESSWKSVLELDGNRNRVSGSTDDLVAAIGRGADLRIYTEFRNNEHLDTDSKNDELVQEVSEFRVTYLLDGRWVAGIMTLRTPIEPPKGFGPRASMSFFLYNQDGQQAIARPYLDGQSGSAAPGRAALDDFGAMPKYHQLENWDANTNAPSHNFVYEFGVFRFYVRDDWRQVLAHDSNGKVAAGSLEELVTQFNRGAEVKLAVRGLCNDLDEHPSAAVQHEVFVHTGSGYYHTQQKLFVAGTHPLVRVTPAIPLQYASRNWDCGWLMARTDGFVARWLVDPYSLKFSKSESRHQLRWFVR